MEGPKPTTTEKAWVALYPVDGGGGGAIFINITIAVLFHFCTALIVITTFYFSNFVAVFAVATQNTSLTQCAHLFLG